MAAEATNGAAMEIEIDEDRESRQIATYGRAALRKLLASKVLISGAWQRARRVSGGQG